MITVVLLLSAFAIIALPSVIFRFICFRMCNCLLCKVLLLFERCSCFSFLAAGKRKGACYLSSRSLIVCSVSMIAFFQKV
jgi:hypothetical protein